MRKMDGYWSGKISGTNTANVFAEIVQEENILSGIARLNDQMYGVVVYSISGDFDGNNVILNLVPDKNSIHLKQKTQIMVDNRPIDIQVPSANYGNVRAEGEMKKDNTLDGKWESTIGTGGTFYLWKEGTQQEKKENLSEIKEINQAFVMMSISPEDFELVDVLNAIKRSTAQYHLDCIRVDEVEHSGKITDLILEYLNTSKFLICDITKERQNVYYELGYAHGRGKEVILIARQGSKIHFDIKDYNTIFYRNITELEEKLSKRLSVLLNGTKVTK